VKSVKGKRDVLKSIVFEQTAQSFLKGKRDVFKRYKIRNLKIEVREKDGRG